MSANDFINWLYGIASAGVLAILGYFLNKRLKKQEQEHDKDTKSLIDFTHVIEIYKQVVEELRKEVSEQRIRAEQIPLLIAEVKTLRRDFEDCKKEMDAKINGINS